MNAPPTLRIFYGGTFDPVHNSHVAIACAARDACRADIRLLPVADPPHRRAPGATAADRAAMVALAIEGLPGLLLDLSEIQRAGRSWTIDTLHALRTEFGDQAPIAWLVGADSFIALPEWRDWTRLFSLTHFIVAEREGSPLDGRLPAELERATRGHWVAGADALREAPCGGILRLRQPLQPQSASAVRNDIAGGRAWRQRVPPAVADYIVDHGLYGAHADAAVIGPPPARSL